MASPYELPLISRLLSPLSYPFPAPSRALTFSALLMWQALRPGLASKSVTVCFYCRKYKHKTGKTNKSVHEDGELPPGMEHSGHVFLWMFCFTLFTDFLSLVLGVFPLVRFAVSSCLMVSVLYTKQTLQITSLRIFLTLRYLHTCVSKVFIGTLFHNMDCLIDPVFTFLPIKG